jgi:hypothetical protein
LNVGKPAASIPFARHRLRISVTPPTGGDDLDSFAVVVAYGYAFEGHCYRLDKPKLIVFSPNTADSPASGCGFDEHYSMWTITTKTELLELSTTVDQAEEIVLAANLPGRRSPNTYGNDMLLAHRGGRLNRGNPT